MLPACLHMLQPSCVADSFKHALQRSPSLSSATCRLLHAKLNATAPACRQYSLSAKPQPEKVSDASRTAKQSNASELPLSGPRHTDAADMELATRELWETASNNTALLSGADRRAALADMLHLMAGAHPVER